MTRETIGVIGLGVMGWAMANHLLENDFAVVGYDVDPNRVEALAGLGGLRADSATDVARRAEIILLSLPSVPALEQSSAAIAAGARAGLLVLEMGTLPLDAKEAARQMLDGAGVELMDVPVSGTGLQAADATLVVFASGSEAGYRRAMPVFEAIARSSYHLGPFGNGSAMKFIANLLVAVHNLAAAEAHVLGIAAGLDSALVQTVMSDGVGASRMLDIRGPMMVADEYAPPAARLDILHKDIGIIAGYARSIGAPTPLLDAASDVYDQARAAGLGDLDAAVLCRHLELSSGLARPKTQNPPTERD